MDNNIHASVNKIKNIYKNLSYFDQYGTSVIIFIVLIVILFWVYGYFNIMTNAQPIKDNWAQYRCNPKVIPFAGFINKPPDKTATEYTQDNFTQCIQTMLLPIVQRTSSPFDYMTKSLLSIFSVLIFTIQKMRAVFDRIRKDATRIVENIYSRMRNVLVPIQQIIIAISDSIAKMVGIMQIGNYTVAGVYLSLKSLLTFIMYAAYVFLNYTFSYFIYMLVILLSVIYIPFLWGYAGYIIALLVTVEIIYIIALKTLSPVTTFGYDVMKIKPPPMPGALPAIPVLCFDKNTLIPLFNGDKKYISEISLGEVLKDGGIVTSIFNLDASNVKMYNLNGVIVSGNHKIRYNHTNINVEDHPSAVPLNVYTESIIYCMNTTTKRIMIEGMKFLDWDEMSHYDIVIMNDVYRQDYPKNKFNKKQPMDYLHKYYDGGLVGDTMITLDDGTIYGYEIEISKIQLGCKLKGDMYVIGKVEIDTTMIKNRNNIIGSNKNNLAENKDKVYHLLTDKGYFYVENNKVPDYNNFIDAYVYL